MIGIICLIGTYLCLIAINKLVEDIKQLGRVKARMLMLDKVFRGLL